jgi:hypothetical protein
LYFFTASSVFTFFYFFSYCFVLNDSPEIDVAIFYLAFVGLFIMV